MPQSSNRLIEAIIDRFGENSKPKAIVLTHGHSLGIGEDFALKDEICHFND